MTPNGTVTYFPQVVRPFDVVTGPDNLLWVTTGFGGHVTAYDVSKGQLNAVADFSGMGSTFDIIAGPDAVYFGIPGRGSMSIGRATTSGVGLYDISPGNFVQHLTMGLDGNIYFTDQVSGSLAIGKVSPLSAQSSQAVVGNGKVPNPPAPPPVNGPTQCPDTTNPAEGTVFNGDVTVNDNGVACLLDQDTVNGNVDVSAGAYADLSFSTINGSVTVETGGQVDIRGSHITGSVTAVGGPPAPGSFMGSTFITVFSSKIDGDLSSTNDSTSPSVYGTSMVCDTKVGGTLTDSGATDTTFPSIIGDPTGPIPCPRNLISGNLILSGNSEQVSVHGNNVGGNIVVSNNTSSSAYDIRDNNAQSLQCSGNAVAPTGGGNHGAESGQCSTL